VSRRLVFRPQAEREINEAADWYEDQGAGLGAEFLRVLEDCIASVERNPHQYPRVHGEVRRAPLRRFPYGLIYRVYEAEVVIVACIHARRDPKHWQGRH
jgi:plasmid stabilization system protein ParE